MRLGDLLNAIESLPVESTVSDLNILITLPKGESDQTHPRWSLRSSSSVAPAATPRAASVTLPDLPDDLADAFESMKLSIARHRLSGWGEISRGAIVDTLRVLERLLDGED